MSEKFALGLVDEDFDKSKEKSNGLAGSFLRFHSHDGRISLVVQEVQRDQSRFAAEGQGIRLLQTQDDSFVCGHLESG